jgi:hypothetical protein
MGRKVVRRSREWGVAGLWGIYGGEVFAEGVGRHAER